MKSPYPEFTQATKATPIDLVTADTDLSDNPSVIFVGITGDLKVDLVNGGIGVTFKNVPSGTILPALVTTVYTTLNGTTASELLALQ